MPFNEAGLAESGYLMRRLMSARQAEHLSASLQFELARSGLDDDDLEKMVDQFRDSPRSREGWGLSTMLNDLLSREPQSVPVSDLQKLQANLKAQGYLLPDFEPTGVWDPASATAFWRFDRDNRDEQRAGRGWYSAPVDAGVKAITNTLPRGVFQGIVGAAKGIVTQAPETAERVGLVGGAAAGAGIGAAVGSVIPGAGTLAGAGIGAGIGGAVGFFADLFGEDEGEEGQSVGGALLDALSPYEEYRDQGARAFFEDLGWVLSAASMVGGAGLAAKGVAGGVAAGRAAGSFAGKVPAALRGGTPGWATRAMAAVSKPVLGANRVERMVNAVQAHGLMAQASRPFFQIGQGAYTGVSTAQMGARLAGGLGGGTSDRLHEAKEAMEADLGRALTEDEVQDLEAKTAATAIERMIAETPKLPEYVDLAGVLLFPTQLLPVKLGQVARSASKVLGNTDLLPLAHVLQDERGISLRKAVVQGRELLGREQALTMTRLRIEAGADWKAAEAVAELGLDAGTARELAAHARARAAIISKVHAGEPGVVEELIALTITQPGKFEASLRDLGRLPDWIEAERLAQGITLDIRSGRVPTEQIGDELRGFVRGNAQEAFERVKLGGTVAEKLAEAGKLDRIAAKATDPTVIAKARADAERIRAEAAAVKASIPKVPGEQRTAENLVIVPGRLDSPTSTELKEAAARFTALRSRMVSTAGEAGTSPQWLEAHMEMTQLVEGLSQRGWMPESLIEGAIKAKPTKEVGEHLLQRARHTAAPIQLQPELMAKFEALGYRPVVTSGDVLFTSEVGKYAEIAGVGDYTRRASFFESLGLSPRWQSNESLWDLRVKHETAELQQVVEEAGLSITAGNLRKRLYDRLSAANSEGVLKGPFVVGSKGRPTLAKIDVRDLRRTDVMDALEDVKGITDEIGGEVYGALRRGSAYGAEVKLMHPRDTLRALGKAMRVNGLPGASDVMRTLHTDPNQLPIIFGAAGGALGAVEGDDVGDVLKGVAGGAVLGIGARFMGKRSYGYLPDQLVRLNTALRYTLSFTFDLGRHTEQRLLAATKFGLPMYGSPSKYIGSARRNLRSPYTAGKVEGEQAWDDALRYFDEINGGNTAFRAIEDIDRRGTARGLLGFTPRDHEAAQAFLLYQRGWSKEKIREAVSQIGRYGLGRTAFEKSANFIFFPFSFSKKLVSSLGEFMLQAPARSLLLHESAKRIEQSGYDEKLAEILEQHAPLIEELWSINSLAFGLSPGRFFLEGLGDNRSDTAKAAQILASVLVPSGAATPLAVAAGGIGEIATRAFVPVVITGESINRAGGINNLWDVVARYIPFIREVDTYLIGRDEAPGVVSQQITALTQGAAPYYQHTAYTDELRAAKAEHEPFALAMGYQSTEGLLQSDFGAIAQADIDRVKADLAKRYPTGLEMTTKFENTGSIDAQALVDIAEKPDRSKAEDTILELHELETQEDYIGALLGFDRDLIAMTTATRLRAVAEPLADDRRFVELWDRFFKNTYGPLVRAA
jgi:hypothetical protein